jgi:hypothetical protein
LFLHSYLSSNYTTKGISVFIIHLSLFQRK